MVRNFISTEKQIVGAARAYLGVPFRHQGRNRYGLDCLGLLVCVANDCDLRKAGKLLCCWDETDYAHIPDSARLINGLSTVLKMSDSYRAGAVVLMEIDGEERHLGILGDYPGGGFSLIHAYAPARRVVEHRLDDEWEQMICRVWVFDD